jgi:hypothetical protein
MLLGLGRNASTNCGASGEGSTELDIVTSVAYAQKLKNTGLYSLYEFWLLETGAF